MILRPLWLGLILCLLCQPSWGDQWLQKGDELARWGAYWDADKAYQKSQAPLVTVLQRRLAVAENLLDERTLNSLSAQLLSLPNLGQESRLRVSLAKATVAGRAWRFKEAQEHYRKAAELARGLHTPEAVLATYVIESLNTMGRWEQEGLPSPAELEKAAVKVASPLAKVPPYHQYPPLDYTRASHCNRLWILYTLWMAHLDPANSAVWVGLADTFRTTNYNLALDRAIKGSDPEAGAMAAHYVLDVADNYLIPVSQSRPALDSVAEHLSAGDQILLHQGQKMGGPRFIEQERLRARWKRAQAHHQLAAGNPTVAKQSWNQAAQGFAKLHQPMDQADTYFQAAYLLWLGGDFTAAAEYAKRTLSMSRELHYVISVASSAAVLGKIHQSLGQLQQAEAAYWESLRTNEAMVVERGAGKDVQGQQLARHSWITEGLIQVLLAQGKETEAVEVLRRHQARELLSSVDLSRVKATQPEVSRSLSQVVSSRERTRELTRELAAEKARPQSNSQEVHRLKTELKSSRARFHTALNKLKTSDPEYERLVAIRPTSFSKIQKKLPADTVLVQYFSGEKTLYLFVATREKLAVLEHPVTRKKLRSTVFALSRAIRRKGKNLNRLEELHSHLIAPLQPFLENRKTLVIAPSEFLYYVPFSALKGERYLAERLSTVKVTSLELFTLFSTTQPNTPNLLAFGDPDGSLPYARKEVAGLAALFQSPKVYYRDQATKTRLAKLPPGTSFVHFATHGVLNQHDASASYLTMAGSGPNGKLTVGEIYGLPLEGVSLVTLSACQSSVGESGSVAEIASMAQAFSVAGSQTMVASLWPVNDRGTFHLMLPFYKHLLAGKGRGEALRLAQIELLRNPEFEHPYFWSAFELLGDWR